MVSTMEIKDRKLKKEITKLFLVLKNTSNESKIAQIKGSIRDAYYRAGAEYFDKGNYEEALKCHTEAYHCIKDHDPNIKFTLLVAIGVDYEKLGSLDKAIEYYNLASQVDGIHAADEAMIHQFIGQCYDKKGNETEAHSHFSKMFSLDQNYDGGWYLLYRFAQLSFEFRNFFDAQRYFKLAKARIPPSKTEYVHSTLKYIGYIYLERGEYKNAKKTLLGALKLDGVLTSRKAELLCGIAQAYFGLNKFNKTIDYSLGALEDTDDDEIAERALYLLAYSYSIRHNKEREDYYKNKLKELKPSSPYLRELEER